MSNDLFDYREQRLAQIRAARILHARERDSDEMTGKWHTSIDVGPEKQVSGTADDAIRAIMTDLRKIGAQVGVPVQIVVTLIETI